MIKDENDGYDIYKITPDKQLNIKKIIIIVLLVVIVIGLILTMKNSIELINQHKIYEQYEAQLAALQKQEEDKQAEIEREKEKIRQERIPNLTQQRKKQYGKPLSFRNQKSIPNF